MKILFVFYLDTEFLLEKIQSCDSNAERLFTTKISKHVLCGCSSLTYCLFDTTKSKHDYHRGKDCTKNLFSRTKRACNKNS